MPPAAAASALSAIEFQSEILVPSAWGPFAEKALSLMKSLTHASVRARLVCNFRFDGTTAGESTILSLERMEVVFTTATTQYYYFQLRMSNLSVKSSTRSA